MNAPLALPGPGPVAPEPEDDALRRITRLSLLTIVLGFGGVLFWAAVCRLDSAVPAPGVIVSAERRKTINLPSTGELKQLLVAEGERVAAGQKLLQLDDEQARAAADQAAEQYWGAMAQAARLQAEAADSRTLTFPPELQRAAADPAIAAELLAERRLFEARWASFDGAARIGRQRVAQQQIVAATLETQIRGAAARLASLHEDLQATQELLAKGFATRLHERELERVVGAAHDQIADLAGRLAGIREQLGQTEQEMGNSLLNRRNDISRDLRAVDGLLADAAGRLRTARDNLEKRAVFAPEDGVITNLHFFTPGSTMGAGQPVFDLVPSDPRLLVEASVAPTDIEHVHVGQKVNVRLTAYKAHQVPVVTGHLVYVSADRQMNTKNEPVFLVRAELDADALAILHDVALYAGMPADVLIIGGERSVLSYMLAPIRDSMQHAMREQ